MAADQRKKPQSAAAAATCHDQGRSINKTLGSRSNVISLQWDPTTKSVVANREQIGLSQRHLVSFASHHSNLLADVLALPQEVFQLGIAKEVFSFEVWQTLVSENERHYLMQFLPEGVDIHKVVQELLLGHSNFHFGNPLLKWCVSLCSGSLHPDAIMHQERCIRASKKTYYNDLVKYHNGMINSLLTWKERWATSKHPEDKLLQEMWMSRKQAGNMSFDENEFRVNKVKEDLAGTSESASSVAEENSGNSENENLAIRDGNLQKGKVTPEDRFNNLAAGLKVLERSKKGERLHKRNIQSRDGSKYMSYIKVSRKQHQRVKSSMKHSSNSIQSRSLNRVLGDLYSFHVQPFELFQEEERKKLHAHWLQLAIKDVPTAFANFRRFQLAKSQLPRYWKQEMIEKLASLNKVDNNEEKDKALVDNGASSNEAADAMEIEEKEQSDCRLEERLDDTVENNELIILSGVVKKENMDSIVEDPKVMNDDEKGSVEHESQFASACMQNQQNLPNITELMGGDISCQIEADSNNYCIIGERVDSQVNDASENLKRRVEADAVGQHSALSSTPSNVWPLVSTQNPLRYSTSNCIVGYPEEQPSRSLILESDDNDKQVTGNNMWHKQSGDGSLLSPYAGADRGVRESLHHHYLKVPDTSLYYNEQQLDLQASSSVEYPGRLGEQLNMPLIDVMRENEREIDNVIRERMFSAEQFPPPMQQHLSSSSSSSSSVKSSIQQQIHWAAANNPTVPTPLPFQSRLSLGPLNNNVGWSNLESSSPVDAGFSNIVDESLYGGVDPSHFNYDNNNDTLELPYARQLIGSGFGYGGSLVPSATSNNMLHGDLLSGQLRTSAAPPLSLVNNNNIVVGGERWINIHPNPNSATQEQDDDPMAKPFSRPRNS